MKPIYTFLLAFAMLIITNTSFAQKIRFTDSTNSWFSSLHGAFDPYGGNRTALYDTATVMHGNTYRRIKYIGYGYSAGTGLVIREDTATKMVYYRTLPSWGGDTVEHVLYNYNLNIGDTIQYLDWGSISHVDSVIAIDSILINGVYHKWFDFKNKVGSEHRAYTVIEGVGCTNNPVYPAFGVCFEYFEALWCFRQNSITPAFGIRRNDCYNSSGAVLQNCSTMDVSKAPPTLTSTTIHPNPASTELNISTASTANITIYDLAGRCILNTQTIKQSTTINTSSWHNGLYMVIVRDDTGILKREMVVIMQ